MILDCSSYETAKNSLLKIFNVSEIEFVELLKSSNPFDHLSLPPENALFDHVCSIAGYPEGVTEVMWFHGTRIEDETLFHRHGILTKTDARKFLEPRLIDLAVGLESVGSNPFSMSLSGKEGSHDEGPFAFLIREVAIQAPSPCHNYLEAPEMVQDLAGIMLGQNYMKLVDRFKQVARPCVVAFLAPAKGYEIPHVLMYVKLVIDGYTSLDAGAAANTFYDAEGEAVLPEQIHRVEVLSGA